MSEFVFTQATRQKSKARIALAGPSGAGKTYTALVLATVLGPGSIAVIDTERGSAAKYAPPVPGAKPGPGEFEFNHLVMHRYDPRDLPQALAAAERANHDVVIVDSMSQFWRGAGGMLEQVENAAKRSFGGNSYGGWKEAGPMETEMMEALLGYPGHLIVTMRTKMAYEIIEDERGRKTPTKIGLKPVQRDGIEYEFDVVGDMDLQNALTISKTRCRPLTGRVYQRPDAQLGHEILDWLSAGAPAKDAKDYRDDALALDLTFEGARALYAEVDAAGLLGAVVSDETGETVTLKNLIVRKGNEARGAARQSTTVTPPSPAERGDEPAGIVPPDDPGAGVDDPAGQEPMLPVAGDPVTDMDWMGSLVDDRILAAKTKAQVTKYRREVEEHETAGTCTAEHAKQIRVMLDEREGEITGRAA